MTRSHSTSLSPEELAKIEQDFDPETSFRQFGPILASIVTFFLENRGSEVTGTLGGMKGDVVFDKENLEKIALKETY